MSTWSIDSALIRTSFIAFLDNRSISIRLDEIVQIISSKDTDANVLLEQLDILIRILRNTGDVAGHVSKDSIISWWVIVDHN